MNCVTLSMFVSLVWPTSDRDIHNQIAIYAFQIF